MSKKNDDFFKRKKIWSTVKDELLGCYLEPYFTKILCTRRPTLYIDCFAGKGKFDDGNLGSPLIALQILNKCINNYHGCSMPEISLKFIELNYYRELATNTFEYKKYCKVISGKFEDEIIPLLKKAMSLNDRLNVFLYIDPYGIKVLNAILFGYLASNFYTAELLVNLNSFGFIREACRVKKIVFREKEDDIFSDLEEYNNSTLNSIQDLDKIAGGNYWQEIISKYSTGSINCKEAEKLFSQRYKKHLKKYYKYVLDMPIRLKKGQHPKYRMVYATNHPDGCTIMADNMARRTDHLVTDIQSGGQLCLLSQTAENEIVSDDMLMKYVKTLVDEVAENPIHLTEFLANFYNKYGVLCEIRRLSSGRSGSILKTLEKNGYIDVCRKPQITIKGKHSKFWTESKGNCLYLCKRS